MKPLFERWDEREVLSLRELYARLDKEDLEERYGRSIENIRYKAKKIRAPKKRALRKPWSPAEDLKLQGAVRSKTYSTARYAELLGRTRRAVESRVRKLRCDFQKLSSSPSGINSPEA